MKWYAILPLIFSVFLNSCATDEKIDAASAEGAYKRAKSFEKNERFEEAISYYNEIKNKHPYSRYAVEAKLAIADIEYKREGWVEAEAAYKLFKEFHPTHAKIDYVTFRLAMCYFNQLPATIDRDLSLANDAIQFFDEVINSYPSSDYVGSARDHKKKALKMLAQKEMYIAEFYFKREKYDSALGRYEDVLRKFPGLGYNAQALSGATLSAYRAKDRGKARSYYQRLTSEHPKSTEADDVQKEVGNDLGK